MKERPVEGAAAKNGAGTESKGEGRMKKSMLRITAGLAGLVFLCGASQAALIDDDFDNDDLATGGVNGGFRKISNYYLSSNPPDPYETNSLAYISTASNQANNSSGIESIGTFDPTTLSEFTVTWEVDRVDNMRETSGQADAMWFEVDSGRTDANYKLNLRLSGLTGGWLQFYTYAGGDLVKYDIGSVDNDELEDGAKLTLKFDADGLEYSTESWDTLGSGTLTWDQLNGNQNFGYDDVFISSTTRVSVVYQTAIATQKSYEIDRITVIPEPATALLLAGASALLWMRRRMYSL
jgi:hypothetical protein